MYVLDLEKTIVNGFWEGNIGRANRGTIRIFTDKRLSGKEINNFYTSGGVDDTRLKVFGDDGLIYITFETLELQEVTNNTTKPSTPIATIPTRVFVDENNIRKILDRVYELELKEGPKGEKGEPGSSAWGDITDKPDTFAPSAHSHSASDLPSATTNAKGIVQLSSSTTSTSDSLAATASAVKAVMDKVNEAFQTGNNVKNETVSALLSKDNSLPITVTSSWSDVINAIDDLQIGVDTSDATATSAQILSGQTAYAKGQKLVGTIPNYANAANTGYVSAQSIKGDGGGSLVMAPPKGYYEPNVNGDGFGALIAADPDYVASNIRAGVDIFGVTGTMTGGKKWKSGTSNASSNSLVVTGLDFTPSFIIAHAVSNPQTYRAIYDFNLPTPFSRTNGGNVYNVAPSQYVYVNSSGFSLPVAIDGVYTWYAFE